MVKVAAYVLVLKRLQAGVILPWVNYCKDQYLAVTKSKAVVGFCTCPVYLTSK